MRIARACRLAGVVALALLAGAPAAWAATLRIVDVSYEQHVVDGGLWTARVRVQNLETTPQSAELVVILTNQVTGEESVPIDVGSPSFGAGHIHEFVQSVSVSAGRYSVTFRILDGNGGRVDQVSGKYPLHVGTNTELLHVFPDALHLGPIPPKRFMHPVPLEIRWDFYRFNQLETDQPFTVRVYTDNASRYRGVDGAIHAGSPAGLVSDDGRFAIPMKIWTVNFGPDFDETGWKSDTMGPPPVDDDTYWKGPLLSNDEREIGAVAWLRIPDYSEMTSDPGSWRRLIGQDPADRRFVTDTNITGDYTLTSPVTVYLATEAGATAVQGQYSATLVVELWSP